MTPGSLTDAPLVQPYSTASTKCCWIQKHSGAGGRFIGAAVCSDYDECLFLDHIQVGVQSVSHHGLRSTTRPVG